MTHPLFRKDIFVETAFAKRFQKMLQDAWDNRSWHLIVADPGAGKTTSIRDMQKRAGGRSVLAVVAPKNNDDEQALGDQFLAALGVPIRGALEHPQAQTDGTPAPIWDRVPGGG